LQNIIYKSKIGSAVESTLNQVSNRSY